MIFLFLRTIVPAFGRFVISFLSRSAFFFAHTDNSFIEDFIFLQNFTAETAKAIRKPFLCNKLKEKPILMIDDIFDKLDFNRVNTLLQLMKKEQFGQVFITDTHPDRIERLIDGALKEKTKIFRL